MDLISEFHKNTKNLWKFTDLLNDGKGGNSEKNWEIFEKLKYFDFEIRNFKTNNYRSVIDNMQKFFNLFEEMRNFNETL